MQWCAILFYFIGYSRCLSFSSHLNFFGCATHTHTHTPFSGTEILLVFHPSAPLPRILNTRLFCFCLNSGEIPTWGKRGRRRTKEKHVGIFFPSQIFRGFSAAITQKCYQMPPDIVGPNTTYLHKVSLSFRIWKCFISVFFYLHRIGAVWKFPTGFWIKYLKDDEDSSAHKPRTKHWNSINI